MEVKGIRLHAKSGMSGAQCHGTRRRCASRHGAKRLVQRHRGRGVRDGRDEEVLRQNEFDPRMRCYRRAEQEACEALVAPAYAQAVRRLARPRRLPPPAACRLASAVVARRYGRVASSLLVAYQNY